MKKIIILIIVVMTVSFTGCQNKEDSRATEFPNEPNTQYTSQFTEDIQQMARNAEALTDHLVSRVFHKGIVDDGEAITDREVFDFFATLPRYTENPEHPYCNVVTKTPDGMFIFPEEMVQQISNELFSIDNWAFDDSNFEYNVEEHCYESGLEFGTGQNAYVCSELQAEYLEEMDVIEVTFLLEGSTSIDGDPGWEDIGEYKVQYQIVRENNTFLRYGSIHKV